jgi:hypothetical protein
VPKRVSEQRQFLPVAVIMPISTSGEGHLPQNRKIETARVFEAQREMSRAKFILDRESEVTNKAGKWLPFIQTGGYGAGPLCYSQILNPDSHETFHPLMHKFILMHNSLTLSGNQLLKIVVSFQVNKQF